MSDVIINSKLLAAMKAETDMLPRVIGRIIALSEEVEAAKQVLQDELGIITRAGSSNQQILFAWTRLDNAVCRMRELNDAYENMISDNRRYGHDPSTDRESEQG